MFEEASVRPWLDELNHAQRTAVTHGEGPLLVVAGAGSGKTKTLACRVAYLIDQGTRPDRILLLTFTRRAAREMLARAERLTGRSASGKVWGGTFHSVANRLLRMYGNAFGLPPNFTVIDQSDGADLMDLVRSELGLGEKGRRFPKKDTLVAIYSRTVNSGAQLGDVIKKHFPWCAVTSDDLDDIASIFESYTSRKRAQQVLDYDDLLLYWRALGSSPESAERIGSMFDHVLVDEYQDTNGIQADILCSLRRTNKNVMVVGDDAQAIYSFRAASIENIFDFPERFENTTIVKLEQNYRSTTTILEATNRVIAHANRRYTKELWSTKRSEDRPKLITCVDETQQSELVCKRVLALREEGLRLVDQAVLFRTGHHSALLEIELSRRNIPFVKFGGLKFVEAAHVKDVLAMLRILENPYDELSWFRVLRLIEGVGAATARKVMTGLGVRREGPVDQSPVVRFVAGGPDVGRVPRAGMDELRTVFADCLSEGLSSSPGAQIERLTAFYEPVVQRVYDSAPARMADVVQLGVIASGYASRSAFIGDLTLEPPSATGDLAGPPLLDEDYLILSTIHSAKGGEWDAVHLLHATDGMIPSDMAIGDEDGIEEERRLFYVALTRAKQHLYLYRPMRYYHRRNGLDDAHNYAQLTRFLPPDCLEAFEQSSIVPAEPEPAPAEIPRITEEVDAFLGSLWTR